MKQTKDPSILAAEKREAEELCRKVMEATESIPEHIRNKASHQTAVAFKEHAHKARKMCETKANRENVVKMRQAWNLIAGYYAKRP